MSNPDASKPVYPISGLWLRTSAEGVVEVLVEHDGEWKLVCGGAGPRPVLRVADQSHSEIVEVAGLKASPNDPLTMNVSAACRELASRRGRVQRHVRRRK